MRDGGKSGRFAFVKKLKFACLRSALMLLIISGLFREAGAATCSALFGPVQRGTFVWQRFDSFDAGGGRMVKRSGYFRSTEPGTEGLRMSFDYSRAVKRTAPRPSAILIHGVLDRREDLDGLANELSRLGWDLLRVDLLGHGRTLELNRGVVDVRSPIEFQTQVSMLTALIAMIDQRFDLRRLVIIGHSLGGGLAMPLAKEARAAGVATIATVPIAPLLLSLDKFLRRQGLTPDVLGFYNERLIAKLHIQNVSEVYSNSLYIQMWQTFFRVLVEPALLISKSPQMEQFIEIMSSINDPLLRNFMEKNFRKYQVSKNNQRPNSAKLTETEIDEFVQGGIAATEGARGVDFQAKHGATGLDPNIATLLISGDLDEVVIPPQVADFRAYAEKKGFDVTFAEISGNHFLPQEQPQVVSSLIVRFLESRGLIPKQTP